MSAGVPVYLHLCQIPEVIWHDIKHISVDFSVVRQLRVEYLVGLSTYISNRIAFQK